MLDHIIVMLLSNHCSSYALFFSIYIAKLLTPETLTVSPPPSQCLQRSPPLCKPFSSPAWPKQWPEQPAHLSGLDRAAAEQPASQVFVDVSLVSHITADSCTTRYIYIYTHIGLGITKLLAKHITHVDIF